LSRGKILARVCELRTDIEIYLLKKKHVLAERFKDPNWLTKLASLSGIFNHMNELYSNMQDCNQSIIDVGENISTFKKKLSL
jgi:hypothetical protein